MIPGSSQSVDIWPHMNENGYTVGWIHTHANHAAHWADNFSAGDGAFMYDIYPHGLAIPAFLANRHGDVFRMDVDIINSYTGDRLLELHGLNGGLYWHGSNATTPGYFHNNILNRYVFLIGRWR